MSHKVDAFYQKVVQNQSSHIKNLVYQYSLIIEKLTMDLITWDLNQKKNNHKRVALIQTMYYFNGYELSPLQVQVNLEKLCILVAHI